MSNFSMRQNFTLMHVSIFVLALIALPVTVLMSLKPQEIRQRAQVLPSPNPAPSPTPAPYILCSSDADCAPGYYCPVGPCPTGASCDFVCTPISTPAPSPAPTSGSGCSPGDFIGTNAQVNVEAVPQTQEKHRFYNARVMVRGGTCYTLSVERNVQGLVQSLLLQLPFLSGVLPVELTLIEMG